MLAARDADAHAASFARYERLGGFDRDAAEPFACLHAERWTAWRVYGLGRPSWLDTSIR